MNTKLKWALSIVMLLVGATAGAAGPLGIGAVTATALFALASWIGTFGVQPFPINAALAVKLAGFAKAAAGALAVHAAHVAAHNSAGLTPVAHAVLFDRFFWFLGIAGTLAGFIGNQAAQPVQANAPTVPKT